MITADKAREITINAIGGKVLRQFNEIDKEIKKAANAGGRYIELDGHCKGPNEYHLRRCGYSVEACYTDKAFFRISW